MSALSWSRIDGPLTWASPPLFDVPRSRATVAAQFGPAHFLDLDSNGIGLFDCWRLHWPSGLEVALWGFHDRDVTEIHSNERSRRVILEHLGWERDDVGLWTPDLSLP